MFSNQLLSKAILIQDQSPTPEFNRYCNINQNVINQVARSVSIEDQNTENDQNDYAQGSNLNDHLNINLKNSINQQIADNAIFQLKSNKNMEASLSLHAKYQLQEQLEERQTKNEIQQSQKQQKQGNQFKQLKYQMLNIQSLATKQIARLKQEVAEKDEQIQKLIDVIKMMKEQQSRRNQQGGSPQKLGKKQHAQMGINTEDDYKNQQIKSLKQALVRHIRINKQLTKRMGHRINCQNDKNAGNLNQSIQKLVSKIVM